MSLLFLQFLSVFSVLFVFTKWSSLESIYLGDSVGLREILFQSYLHYLHTLDILICVLSVSCIHTSFQHLPATTLTSFISIDVGYCFTEKEQFMVTYYKMSQVYHENLLHTLALLFVQAYKNNRLLYLVSWLNSYHALWKKSIKSIN